MMKWDADAHMKRSSAGVEVIQWGGASAVAADRRSVLVCNRPAGGSMCVEWRRGTVTVPCRGACENVFPVGSRRWSGRFVRGGQSTSRSRAFVSRECHGRVRSHGLAGSQASVGGLQRVRVVVRRLCFLIVVMSCPS